MSVVTQQIRMEEHALGILSSRKSSVKSRRFIRVDSCVFVDRPFSEHNGSTKSHEQTRTENFCNRSRSAQVATELLSSSNNEGNS